MGCGRSITVNHFVSFAELKREKTDYEQKQQLILKLSSQTDLISEIKQFDLTNYSSSISSLESKYSSKITENKISVQTFDIIVKHLLSIDVIKVFLDFKEIKIDELIERMLRSVFYSDKDQLFLQIIFNNIKRNFDVSQIGISIKPELFDSIKPIILADIAEHLKYNSTFIPHLINLYLSPKSVTEEYVKTICEIMYCNTNLSSLILNFELYENKTNQGLNALKETKDDKKHNDIANNSKICNYTNDSINCLSMLFSCLKSNPHIQMLILNCNNCNMNYINNSKDTFPERIHFHQDIWLDSFINSIQSSKLEILIINKIIFTDLFWKKFVLSLSKNTELRFIYINSALNTSIIESLVKALVSHPSLIGIYFGGITPDKQIYNNLLSIINSNGENKFKYFGFVKELEWN